MIKIKKVLIALIVLFFITCCFSIYTINSKQKGLLITFAKVEKNHDGSLAIKNPGLHFKLPFVSHVKKYDMRSQILTVDSEKFVTKGGQGILVDYYVTWHIADLARYSGSFSENSAEADAILQQKISANLDKKLLAMSLGEIITAKYNQTSALMPLIRELQSTLGIAVTDVAITNISLPSELNSAIFDRMRADEEQLAIQTRAQASDQAANIKNAADEKNATDLAKANEQAAAVRAEGDKKANEIYLTAYKKNPAFFTFYSGLQVYNSVLNNKNTLFVLSPNGKFFNSLGISK